MLDPHIHLLSASEWQDYALLDSGEGQKLECFGPYTFVRPEAQALWRRGLPLTRWEAADAVFQPAEGKETGGSWQVHRKLPEDWPLRYKNLRFLARFSNSRHLGVFPEQAAHWDWLAEQIRPEASAAPAESAPAGSLPRVLNLFGYTGLASLAASQAGAQVTHVDAAKKSVAWARQNQALSGLGGRPIRWIVDDALKFVQREARRESHYEAIVMDPPKFGRGPQGEVWEALEMLPRLLAACREVLSPQARCVVITAYAIRASALSLGGALHEMTHDLGGQVTCGELTLPEQSASRQLSLAIYARWSRIE